MNWYFKVMKEGYSDFNGRARRKEYWMFVLFYYIVIILATVLDGVLGLGFDMGYGVKSPYGWITVLVGLAHIIPSLAVAIRRMHDVGKSGWFLFISLIPLIGGIWLLVLACTDGETNENKYGSNPKEA